MAQKQLLSTAFGGTFEKNDGSRQFKQLQEEGQLRKR